MRPNPVIAFWLLLACPFTLARVIVEPLQKTNFYPVEWKKMDDKNIQDQVVTLLVAIKQRNIDALEHKLDAIATPESPEYGRYLSDDDIRELIQPHETHIHMVSRWLDSYNLQYHLSTHRDWAIVTTKISQAESLLGCKYHHFVHSTTGSRIYRCIENYSINDEVAAAVEFVAGVTRFPRMSPVVAGYGDDQPPVNPSFIQKLYKITHPPVPASNLQAVVSFLGQYYSPSDFAQFQQTFNLPNIPIEQLYGPNYPNTPGVEASLDVQYLTGVTGANNGPSGPNIRTWVYSTAGNRSHDDEPFLRWLVFLGNQSTIPWVFSISYQDYSYYVNPSYEKRVSSEFMKYSSKGHTFVTGSGDWGVGCHPDFYNCTKFVADFPSASPYIVSTGGTFWNGTGEAGIGFSSGGFSYVFDRPSFQKNAVQQFLSQNTVPTSYFATKGRGFPDVSAIAHGFAVVVDGNIMSVDGTSAATPTFAAVLSQINSLRIAKNLPTLGWVNPFLYKAATHNGFTDITQCQKQQTGCCATSFSCAVGWDPYTGLGTPKYDVLSQLAMDHTIFNFPQ